jgi:acyl-CoA synthetase (AMP-forming)/AMP-acid ligase II
VWLGAAKAGSAIAPFSWRSSTAELVELIDDAQPPVVFVGDGLREQLGEAGSRSRSSFVIASDLDSWPAPHPADDPRVPLTGAETVLLTCTSGTTGRPALARRVQPLLPVLVARAEPGTGRRRRAADGDAELPPDRELGVAAGAAVAVVGAPGPQWGEAVTAFVVLTPGSGLAGWIMVIGAIVTIAAVTVAYQVILPQISTAFEIAGTPGTPACAPRPAARRTRSSSGSGWSCSPRSSTASASG